MFNNDIVDFYTKNGKRKMLQDIQEIIKEHDDLYIYKLIPQEKKPKSLVGQNSLMFLQNTLYRSKSMSLGWVDQINNKNTLMILLAVRAHFETVGLLGYVYDRLLSYYKQNIDEDSMILVLRRACLGRKITLDGLQTVEPYNVMKGIDSIDKLYNKNSNISEKLFREMYDELSEFCHPNFLGLQVGNTINKIAVVRFDDELELKKECISSFNFLFTSLDLFFDIHKKMNALIIQKEEIPRIVFKKTQSK